MEAFAIGITLLIAIGGALGWRYKRRKAMEPQIVWSPLRFFGPGEHERWGYRCAVGFRVRNVGEGTAIRPMAMFMDMEQDIFCEHVSRGELLPGEEWVEWAGIRGQEPEDDPTDEEASEFFERRCVGIVECWDRLGRHYLYFPWGGGLVKDHPWRGPEHPTGLALQFPSRGERGESMGAGPVRYPPEEEDDS